jgi:hypothetical protein
MTGVNRILTLQYGKHANVADVSTAPVTFRNVDLLEGDFLPRTADAIERPLASTDGRRFPATVGKKLLDPLPCSLRLRGFNGNSGGAITAANIAAGLDTSDMFDSLFGADVAAIVGAAPTVAGGASPNLTASSGVIANGDMVVFQTSTGTFAREVVSGGGTANLVLDRAYTGTPVAASTIFRAPGRWNWSTSITAHKHLGFRAEGQDWRVDYLGCMADGFEIDFKEGEALKLSSSWMPTDWSQATEANPSYSAPGAGNEIVALNVGFYIGDAEFLAKDLKLSAKLGTIPRPCANGPNGVYGYLCPDKTGVSITGGLYVGDNPSSLGELQYAAGSPSARDLQHGSSSGVYVPGTFKQTRDIAIEIASVISAAAVGPSVYLRAPAADFRGRLVDEGGLLVFRFEAFCTAPATGGAMRLGIF